MPGMLVAFLMGMFWRRSTPAAGFATILGGMVYSWLVEFAYNTYHLSHPGVSHYFGQELNFFHRVVLVMLLCARHPGGGQLDRQARPGQGKAGLDRPHRPFIPAPRQGRHRPAGLYPVVRLPRLVGLSGVAEPVCGGCAGSRLDPGAFLGGHGKSHGGPGRRSGAGGQVAGRSVLGRRPLRRRGLSDVCLLLSLRGGDRPAWSALDSRRIQLRTPKYASSHWAILWKAWGGKVCPFPWL